MALESVLPQCVFRVFVLMSAKSDKKVSTLLNGEHMFVWKYIRG